MDTDRYEHSVMSKLFVEYTRIMKNEAQLRPACKYFISHPADIYQAANYIAEIAKASILQRGWCHSFGLTDNYEIAFESDGAHTNLMMAMVDRALAAVHGAKFEDYTKAYEGFSYRDIMEAVRLHDLPENDIGDWLDNGSRDEEEKTKLENHYYASFQFHYYEQEEGHYYRARRLLDEMRERKPEQELGRLLYSADKASAVIAALTYDAIAKKKNKDVVIAPAMHESASHASERDREEMELCDFSEDGYKKASEMFTVDILHIRQINEYDDTGFFTALIVMYTLMVNGHWYKWREKDYATTILGTIIS